jgi:hypothetical protein
MRFGFRNIFTGHVKEELREIGKERGIDYLSK